MSGRGQRANSYRKADTESSSMIQNKDGGCKPSDQSTNAISDVSNTCGVCNKTVRDKDKGLKCDICNFWHHIKCESIDDKTYEAIKSLDEQDDQVLGIHWYCRKCNVSAAKILGAITRLESKVNSLENRMETSEKRIDKLEQGDKDAEVVVNKVIDMKISEAREEDLERAKRRRNLVVRGVPESNSENIEERIDHDTGKVSEVFKQLELPQVEMVAVTRLGAKFYEKDGQKQVNNSRPIKVVLRSEDAKNEILRKSRIENMAELLSRQNISLKQDYTAKQREENKALWEELEQRKRNGETDLVIRRGKVIRQQRRN